MTQYHKKANGKLLISSEYFVLDGALALALPTKFGQSLTVKPSDTFHWKSIDNQGNTWIEFNEIIENNQDSSTQILTEIVQFIGQEKFNQLSFEFNLDFSREWGLGSSSTFISLIADYFQMNPYELNRRFFRGSGYDIACAFATNPIVYSNKNKIEPDILNVELSNQVTPYLYFVYLGQKQNSRMSIEHYDNIEIIKDSIIYELNILTHELINSYSYTQWIDLLTSHESIISHHLKLEKVSNTTLKDLPYFSKSLGAWGGDFAMIITDEDPQIVEKNVNKLGYHTFFKYKDLII